MPSGVLNPPVCLCVAIGWSIGWVFGVLFGGGDRSTHITHHNAQAGSIRKVKLKPLFRRRDDGPAVPTYYYYYEQNEKRKSFDRSIEPIQIQFFCVVIHFCLSVLLDSPCLARSKSASFKSLPLSSLVAAGCLCHIDRALSVYLYLCLPYPNLNNIYVYIFH